MNRPNATDSPADADRRRDLIRYARDQTAHAEKLKPLSKPADGHPWVRNASDTASPPPNAIPGHVIVEEVHRGGQGVVYKAVQSSTKREVALKVLRDGLFAGPDERARFDREVEILARLKHPNIVGIHVGGTVAGHRYFVMDYIAGESLDAHIARGDRPIRATLSLFLKICDAVAAAPHVRGVVHRDLKPSNIRVDAAGEPHILDFGLAKMTEGVTGPSSPAERVTLTGQFVGSLPWATPEQAEGESHKVDVRTDVYALGVLLFQMLTARFPYMVVGSTHDVLDNILRTEPTRPGALRRDIDDEIDTIVLKCLAKQPDRRYQSAGELARDVKRYLAGEPIEAKRDSTWYMLTKTVRRHRTVAVAMAVFLGLAVAYAATVTILYRRAATAEHRSQEHAADAREKFALSVDTLALVVQNMSERLSNVAGAAGARRDVLELAFKGLQSLTADHSDDPPFKPANRSPWRRPIVHLGSQTTLRIKTIAVISRSHPTPPIDAYGTHAVSTSVAGAAQAVRARRDRRAVPGVWPHPVRSAVRAARGADHHGRSA